MRLVVLTSSYSSASVRERERAGILRCVHKPIRQAELFEVLCSALRAVDAVPAATAVADEWRPTRGGRVLLAEDNPVNQQVGLAMLAKLGIAVRVANDGEEAVKLAATEAFDLILMDCHMPVLDGYEASTAIRASEHAPRVPIVALTANVMEGNRERCLAAGMDDFLAKPYALEQLQSTLQRWMAATPASAPATPCDAATEAEATEVTEAAIDRTFIEQFRELDPDGGMALAARILRVYAESSAPPFAEIERATAAGDAAGLRRAAHSLKSSAGNVGARRLAALLKDFESLGKDGRIDDARAGLAALRTEHARTLDAIHALIEEFGR